MKTMCRDTATPWRRQQVAVAQLLRHAIIVTDPHKLAQLNAQAAIHNQRRNETVRHGARRHYRNGADSYLRSGAWFGSKDAE